MMKIAMKNTKAFLRFLVLFLGFFYLLSSTPVTATRNLKANNQNPPSVQDFISLQDSVKFNDAEGVFGLEEKYIEGRMDFESTDYPGTGANNHHDPKTPGRA